MVTHKGIAWWYWLATAVLLTAYLAGVPGAREVAGALLVVQVVHFRLRGRSFTAFSAQIRAAYLAIFVVGMAPHLAPLHWIQTIGVWAQVIAGYCLLARLLALVPWNREVRLTLDLVRFAIFSPPLAGSILGAVANRGTAGVVPPKAVS